MHEVIKRAVLHPGGKGLFLAQQFKHRTDHLQQFMSDLEASAAMPPIDPSIEKFPYCIVWTPIPCITWLLPFIGAFSTPAQLSKLCIVDVVLFSNVHVRSHGHWR
jgi:hypothetical protein